MKFTMQKTLALSVILASTAFVNCSKGTSSDDSSLAADTSSSGVVASSIGGALSDSSSGGTQAFYKKFNNPVTASWQNEFAIVPKASAAGLCPTFLTMGTGCSTTGGTMWLTYSDCTFTGHAEWNGVQAITMSAGSASCGTFPSPGASQTLSRQIVTTTGGSTPGSLTLTAGGLTATIDDATANLGNFDSQIIASNVGSGYGSKVTFNSSGFRSNLSLAHHLTVDFLLDHSVTGSVTVTESTPASSRTLNGTVTVYHNLMRIVGTSILSNVVHENVCCLPVSGSITTSFAAGQNVTTPRAGGDKYIGKSEVLTFTGCGTATFQDINGNTANVTLNRCF
jgi:hypothetical protein